MAPERRSRGFFSGTGAAIETPRLTAGRVAQRESTSLTWKGSQVRSLSRPPPSLAIMRVLDFLPRNIQSILARRLCIPLIAQRQRRLPRQISQNQLLLWSSWILYPVAAESGTREYLTTGALVPDQVVSLTYSRPLRWCFALGRYYCLDHIICCFSQSYPQYFAVSSALGIRAVCIPWHGAASDLRLPNP
jgi:hypothetical protein